MRHQLFEETMKEKDFNLTKVCQHIKKIVRKNAEGILACGSTSTEASKEVFKVFQQLTKFASEYTSFGPESIGSGKAKAVLENHSSNGDALSIFFVAEEVEAVEETIISPELGLKGNIDMIVKARIGKGDPRFGTPTIAAKSLLGIELKTGHFQQTQNAHLAQLALYILMMKSIYGSSSPSQVSRDPGATESGLLLYMNNESIRAVHVAPMLSEIKSLIGQRNLLAIEQVRASKPRGVVVSTERNYDELNKNVPR